MCADCEAEREQIADKELNCGAANDELKELVVKASQLAGAVALDSHNVDAGKKLLLGALVAACELQSKAEEAHCLRWVGLNDLFLQNMSLCNDPSFMPSKGRRLGLANCCCCCTCSCGRTCFEESINIL